MNLRDIAVRSEAASPALLGGIRPLLHEVEALLAALVESGQGGSVDLRGLPMSPAEFEALEAALGEGEVRATVRALGETEVRETAVRGVWRVTHRTDDGHVVGEFVEVCHVPEILKTHVADTRAALVALQARLKAQ